jgi:hypothetical protein
MNTVATKDEHYYMTVIPLFHYCLTRLSYKDFCFESSADANMAAKRIDFPVNKATN